MSHFTILKTQLTDPHALTKALSDAGYKQVEVHEVAQPLYGYRGDQRPETAEIIIRRNYVGASSNDLGFKRQTDGTYTAIISSADRYKHNQEWLNKVSQRHAYHVTMAKLAEQGFTLLQDEQQQDGRIHITVRRMV
jgi:Protein of unknown function (DUF1257)